MRLPSPPLGTESYCDSCVSNNSRNIAVLVSGNGSNLQAIIDQIQQGLIQGGIACVISNKKNAYGLVRAKRSQIPTHVVEHTHYPSRKEFEKKLIATLKPYNFDLIVLAGFMRVLSKLFVYEYRDRILNIHPSLLPKFPGLHTHRRVLEAGDTEHGSSVHFVTPGLDEGPLVIQAKIAIKNSDDPDSLERRVKEKEHVILPLAVRWFIEDRLSCVNETTYLENKPLDTPISFLS